jgi:hypothetical protein
MLRLQVQFGSINGCARIPRRSLAAIRLPANTCSELLEPMSDAEEIWRRRSDEQLLEAAQRLEDYTDEGRRVIRAELLRRGMTKRDQAMHIYMARVPGEGMQNIVSVLPETIVFVQGLVPQAIVGKLLKSAAEGGTLVPRNFARNKEFVDFLHEIIARYGPDLPGLIAEAKRLGSGRVYVIDGRTRTPQGDVPPHDIIGAFRVEGGVVARETHMNGIRITSSFPTTVFQYWTQLCTSGSWRSWPRACRLTTKGRPNFNWSRRRMEVARRGSVVALGRFRTRQNSRLSASSLRWREL